MTSPSFSDRDQDLREQMAGRRMAEPKDMDPFWQRQRELTLGRIETPEPIKVRAPLWMWLIAVPLCGVAIISIIRGVS
jgi:hypothetical protein